MGIKSTFQPCDSHDLDLTDVQKAVKLPVLVGSGVTEDNIGHYISANGIIIGSHLKMHGLWDNDLDHIRVNHFMQKVDKLRRQLRVGQPASEFGAEDEEFKPMHAQGE